MTLIEEINKFLDWKIILGLIFILIWFIGKPYLGNYVENDPLYCGRYSDLYYSEDQWIQSCRLTCAKNENCSIAWSNNTYYNYDTNICHCGPSYINYTCYIDGSKYLYSLPQSNPCLILPEIVGMT